MFYWNIFPDPLKTRNESPASLTQCLQRVKKSENGITIMQLKPPLPFYMWLMKLIKIPGSFSYCVRWNPRVLKMTKKLREEKVIFCLYNFALNWGGVSDFFLNYWCHSLKMFENPWFLPFGKHNKLYQEITVSIN